MPLFQTTDLGAGQPPKTRIVILGGGFGGVTTARHLERLCKRRRDVEMVLVSRDNFLLMTPLLFEVCSRALGDCAAITAPDGRAYPSLAQHALREARVLARNIAGVLDGRPPRSFVYATPG